MALSSLQLEAFYRLAQVNHFTLAAQQLGITQSALSQRVQNLEEDLKTTLFIRDRSGVHLTETGQELLRYCQTSFGLEEEFVSKLKSKSPNKLVGKIRIAGYSSVVRSVILPALSSLIRANPELRISLMTKELHELPGLLKRGEADFIVSSHKLEHSNIAVRELGKERNVLVERKNYSGPDVYLDHDENDQTTLQYLKIKGRNQTIKIERHYLDDVYGILSALELGLGRAILPLHLIQNRKNLKIADPKTAIDNPVLLQYYEQPFYTALHHKIVAELKEHCPSLLPG